MKRLLVLIVLAAAVWSGWWLVGASSLRTGYAEWFAARRAEGWQADYGDLTVRGYPNRLDTTFTDLALADPASGLAWEAPFFQLLRLSYRPGHLIAVWPERQAIATPRRKLAIEAQDMRASLLLSGSAPRTLERATLTAENLRLVPQEGETWAASRLVLAAEREAGAMRTYRLGLSADGLAPPVPAAHGLPETLEGVTLDLAATLDQPADSRALSGARPQPVRLDLRRAEASWGALALHAAGTLEIDAEGRPEGRLDIRLRNWREMLDLARGTGAMEPALAAALTEGLTLLARLSGDAAVLDLPLEFSGGRMWLGPVPLGDAPRLRLP